MVSRPVFAMPPVPGAWRTLARLLLLLLLPQVVVVNNKARADDSSVSITPQSDGSHFAGDGSLQLVLNSKQDSPLQYTVVPLADDLRHDESSALPSSISIKGRLIVADVSNYDQISGPDEFAYLSCDTPSSDTFVDPDAMLETLMKNMPNAIILYSTTDDYCSLSVDGDDDLTYLNILSMADAAESIKALSYLNRTDSGSVVEASISGNTTDSGNGDDDYNPDTTAHHDSHVAMSALYAVTAVIVFLFLVVIVLGGIKAYRHPERYGPRGQWGGGPRQSRAKGLAKAVLDTLPIVKFSHPESTKSDMELSVEAVATGEARSAVNSLPAEPTVMSTVKKLDATTKAKEIEGEDSSERQGQAVSEDEEHSQQDALSCSICTEIFQVGEDVRVLPCNHQFHPYCVDPWLINVSGTCPLCRLDLRPEADRISPVDASSNGSSATAAGNLPPPLALGDDPPSSSTTQSFRSLFSRANASLSLGQHHNHHYLEQQQQQQQQQSRESVYSDEQPHAEATRFMRMVRAARARGHHVPDGEDGGGARLAERLRDRFRIRTRAQRDASREEEEEEVN